jgi:uncharacterized membrane protein AbrB (regulator of aidB expression)
VALLLLATDTRYLTEVGMITFVGLMCSLVAYILSRGIQRDITAVVLALEPGRDPLSGGDTSESFWTASR